MSCEVWVGFRWAIIVDLIVVLWCGLVLFVFFFQAEDGIRDGRVTGVQTCALPISGAVRRGGRRAADRPAVLLPWPRRPPSRRPARSRPARCRRRWPPVRT